MNELLSGIYIHIPFCKQACHYCDFHFTTSTKYKSELVQSIIKEVELQHDFLPSKNIDTIYFGGGTPSLLSTLEIEKIIHSIGTTFNINTDIEITLEANPDDLTEEKIKELAIAGINRLSIGTQTFNKDLLKFLNRAHNEKEAIDSIELALKHFDNISVDLIYGIHDQSLETFREDINILTSLSPQHVSAYALTIEGNNAFARWKEKGTLKPEDDDLAISHFQLLIDELSSKGYDQYEISNFSKPNYESKHNTSYWFGKSYLGLGPSAHSFNGSFRQYNIAHNMKYIDSIQHNNVPFEKDTLNNNDRVNEYIMTRLRTKWGVNLKELKDLFFHEMSSEQNRIIDSYCSSNQLYLKKQKLTLTENGKLIADQIASDLFIL